MRASNLLGTSMFVLLLATAVACAPPRGTGPRPASSRVGRLDHVMIGTRDLDRAVDDFERATGVRPVYGGKHPAGTHNALVALDAGAYLELIALQPGQKGEGWTSALASFEQATPLGWAASPADETALRASLQRTGFSTTPSKPGSRTTPSGTLLKWQTFSLQDELPGAPFFIAWAPSSASAITALPSPAPKVLLSPTSSSNT